MFYVVFFVVGCWIVIFLKGLLCFFVGRGVVCAGGGAFFFLLFLKIFLTSI